MNSFFQQHGQAAGCFALTLFLSVSATAADAKSGFSTLYAFQGGSDGAHPYAGLLADKAGNLYGSTEDGGADGYGTIFKLAPNGTKTTLHSFAGGSDGINPFGGVIADAKGNLYGTTYQGGAHGDGTVFEIAADGTETVLYSFSDMNGSDGADPYAGLIRDGYGNLYGTTMVGGANGQGTVFKIAKSGKEELLYSFHDESGSDGADPAAGLIFDAKGDLFGTTTVGGAHGQGSVFEVSSKDKESVLHSFADDGGSDGAAPYAALLMDKSGSLYGTTSVGGANGQGAVFKVAPGGSETLLYSFDDNAENDGADPYSSLVMDKRGNFYGTTSVGGTNGDGTIFKISPNGQETVLYSFTGGSDGAIPMAGLVSANGRGKKNVRYGAATVGGANGEGTIFAIGE
jgi:uncharacterized repeat protein (TIGR03803 family)